MSETYFSTGFAFPSLRYVLSASLPAGELSSGSDASKYPRPPPVRVLSVYVTFTHTLKRLPAFAPCWTWLMAVPVEACVEVVYARGSELKLWKYFQAHLDSRWGLKDCGSTSTAIHASDLAYNCGSKMFQNHTYPRC